MNQGRVVNQETDRRVKYELDADQVTEAMEKSGATDKDDLHPGSEYGPAKQMAEELGMNKDDLNVRRGIARFVEREDIHPQN